MAPDEPYMLNGLTSLELYKPSAARHPQGGTMIEPSVTRHKSSPQSRAVYHGRVMPARFAGSLGWRNW